MLDTKIYLVHSYSISISDPTSYYKKPPHSCCRSQLDIDLELPTSGNECRRTHHRSSSGHEWMLPGERQKIIRIKENTLNSLPNVNLDIQESVLRNWKRSNKFDIKKFYPISAHRVQTKEELSEVITSCNLPSRAGVTTMAHALAS